MNLSFLVPRPCWPKRSQKDYGDENVIDSAWAQHFCCIKNRSILRYLKGPVKVVAQEDTMFRTQMFPRLRVHATFVADTKFVSETQKVFLTKIRMFPCLCGMDTKQMFCVLLVYPPKKHHEQQCVCNNVVLKRLGVVLKNGKCIFSLAFYQQPFHTKTVGLPA